MVIPTDVFVQRFRDAAGGSLPTRLVDSWEQVIEFCEAGYHDVLDEYRFDLSVRDSIERTLHDEPLRECPQMGWVRAQVAALDGRFRALLQEDVVLRGAEEDPWWFRHPPKYAAAEAAAEFARCYGVQVEIRGG